MARKRPILRILRCDMKTDCPGTVAMIDDRGFLYCADHGHTRRTGGGLCRKLAAAEIKRLQSKEPIKYRRSTP